MLPFRLALLALLIATSTVVHVVPLLLRNAVPFDGRNGTPSGAPGQVGLPVLSRSDEAWMSIDPESGEPLAVVRP